MDTTYQLGGKTIRSRLGLPSGVVGTKASVLALLAELIPALGLGVTKSTSFLPKKGNNPPIFAQYQPWSGINAVGLDNPGAEEFARQLSGIKFPKDFFLMISIFGATPEDFLAAAKILLPFADGFELNLSCSHSKGFGFPIGQDLDLVVRIIKVIVPLGKPVFLKLSAKMDVEAIVKRTRGLGIAGYATTNTLGPEPFEIDGNPVLTNKVGSLSGRIITDKALESMRIIRENTDLTIIGGGGLFTADDIYRAQSAGAQFFTIGTALTGMSTAQLVEYFPALMADLEHGTDNAGKILEDVARVVIPGMEYRKVEVAERQQLAADLFFLRFTKRFDAKPGQFVFVWIPEKGERPFSVFDTDPFSLLISARGECTRALSQLRTGDSVYVRGPYGTVPKVNGTILLVGGGTGVAGLYLFAKHHTSRTIAVLGAKDKAHLYDTPFRESCGWVYPIMEKGCEGSLANRGLVTDHLEEILYLEKPDFCLNCGPLPMIKAAIPIEEKYLQEHRILSSVDSYMACGVKICGQCATLAGFTPCVDGTFMTRTQLGL